MDDEVLLLIRKLALLNAVKHDGKAVPGGVISGVIGSFPDLKKDMKIVSAEVNEIIKKVNSLDIDSQKKELLDIDGSALESKHKDHDIFGFLNIKEGDFVRTAFPPGPEKYPHIGHAKALIINYELAKRHNGEFILRFEDTNPELVRKEFYDIMLDNFRWLGVSWNNLVYASDYMDLYYGHCEDLIKKGLAYVCTASQDDIKKMRETGVSLAERNSSPEQNLKMWKSMFGMKKGEAVVLLKIDLNHKNSTMRDPIIFRIIDSVHARHGSKYRVWPNYDFQNSIMDGYFKITHRLRSKEFEMRNELQRYIQKTLGYPETHIYEFARFNLEGVESSGRIIREKVASGELVGWDDPTLTTIVALRRRGFQPEAIKDFVLKTGITKSESTLTWDDLIVQNKKIVDKSAERLFFVEDPVKVHIDNAPSKKVHLKSASFSKLERTFGVHTDFYISKKDFESLEKGSVYRLIECFNFRFEGSSKFSYVDESIDTFKKNGKGMLHYLPATKDVINASVLMPDKTICKGLIEKNVELITEGSVVQLERFGFVRLDNKKDHVFWFTHK